MKAEVRQTENRGKGLFAIEPVLQGEEIFDWEGGPVYEAQSIFDLPKEIQDHAIQFREHAWIDTSGVGRYSNHSCEPNAGIRGLFKLVALRDIEAGEEITWDYDTTENSEWQLEECKCGSAQCRKNIRGYRFLSNEVKEKLKDRTSDWLKLQS
jgi:SET domain-containing protein